MKIERELAERAALGYVEACHDNDITLQPRDFNAAVTHWANGHAIRIYLDDKGNVVKTDCLVMVPTINYAIIICSDGSDYDELAPKINQAILDRTDGIWPPPMQDE